MNLTDLVTTKQQSQKLQELGYASESAFVYGQGISNRVGLFKREDCHMPLQLPAYTLGEMIALAGENFNGLVRKGPTVWLGAGGIYRQIFGDEYLLQGITPIESVYSLLVALKSK